MSFALGTFRCGGERRTSKMASGAGFSASDRTILRGVIATAICVGAAAFGEARSEFAPPLSIAANTPADTPVGEMSCDEQWELYYYKRAQGIPCTPPNCD